MINRKVKSKIENFECKIVLAIVKTETAIIKAIQKVLWPVEVSGIQQYKTICVYKPGNIGDLMCAIPAFNSVREHFPGAKIVLLTHGGQSINARSILKGFRSIDEMIFFSVDDLRTFSGWRRIRTSIIQYSFDALLFFPVENAGLLSQLKHLLILKPCNIKTVRGCCISHCRLFQHAQYLYRDFKHETIRLLETLPFNTEKIDYRYDVSAEDKLFVDAYLKEKDISIENLLLISPEGKGSAKTWPSVNFGAVAVNWIKNFGQAAVVGSNISDEIVKDICSYGCKDLTNKFTIQQSLYLMSVSKFVLSVDTGTIHMAMIAQVPCLGIYSSQQMPSQWYPYGEKSDVIVREVKCSGCRLAICPHNNMCIKLIEPEDVWKKMQSMLEKYE